MKRTPNVGYVFTTETGDNTTYTVLDFKSKHGKNSPLKVGSNIVVNRNVASKFVYEDQTVIVFSEDDIIYVVDDGKNKTELLTE